MGLIEKAAEQATQNSGRSLHKASPERSKKMIALSGELTRIVDRVLQANLTDPELVTRLRGEGCRTKIVTCNWPVANVQNNVDQGIWATMVGRALEGLEHTVEHRQPNGKWLIAEYEQEMKEFGDADFIVLAVEFIDRSNSPDMEYKNGVPAINVQVNSALPKEILDLLARQAAAPAGDGAPSSSETTLLLIQLVQGLKDSMDAQNRLTQRVLDGQQTRIQRDAEPVVEPVVEPTLPAALAPDIKKKA